VTGAPTDMTARVEAGPVGRIAAVVEDRTGIRLQGAHRKRLHQALLQRLGAGGLEAYADRVAREPEAWRDLIPTVAVGETRFFRDRARWRALEDSVLPGLARTVTGRPLALWSAGCATGQEAYGLAMVCDAVARRVPALAVEIVGSDVNPEALQVARRGVYDAHGTRGLEPDEVERFFEPHEGGHRVRAELRERVRFEALNLAQWARTGPRPGRFDLILCQRVLIYFAPPLAEQVLEALAHSLHEGGMLMVGHSESMRAPEGCTLEWVGASCGFRRTLPAPEPARFAPRRPAAPEPAPRDRAEVIARAWDDAVAERYRAARERLGPLPADAAALRLAAWIGVCRGALDEARPLVARALSADVQHPEAHFVAGMLAAAEGAAEAAIGHLKRAVYLDPRFSVAHFHLADLEMARGHRERAARAWRNAAAASAGDGERIRRYGGGFDTTAFAQACAGRLRAVEAGAPDNAGRARKA
jgi:chemotaxis protein methyltransferase CheR